MKRDIIMSLTLHVILISLAFMTSPFSLAQRPVDYGDAIKIKAVYMPDFKEAPAVSEPVSVPKPVDEDVIDIPMDDPVSIEEPKPIDKPKPEPEKPKEKPKDKPKKQTQTQTETKADKPQTESSGNKEIETNATGAGSPFAGATIDNASFDYPYWFTQAFNKIAYNFRKTVSLDANVVCVLHFQVLRSGRVIELKVEQSSGYDAVDKDCLAAINRSTPFPPLPKDFRDEIIGIRIPIKY